MPMVAPVNRTTLAGAPTSAPRPIPLPPIELEAFAGLAAASDAVPALLGGGQVAEAVAAAQQAVTAERANFIHWCRLGVCLAHAGRLAEAEAAFARSNALALEQRPNLDGSPQARLLASGYAPASLALATLFALDADLTRARAYLEAAVAGAPDPEALLEYARSTEVLRALAEGLEPAQPEGDRFEAAGRFGPAYLPRRDGEADDERLFRVRNDMLLAAAQEAGLDPAELTGLLSDLSFGSVAPDRSAQLLEVLGSALLAQTAGEDIDVTRWLGSDNPREVFDQVARDVANELLSASLGPRLHALGLAQQVRALVLSGQLPTFPLEDTTREQLGRVLLHQLVEQGVTVAAHLGPELTAALYQPIQGSLASDLLGPGMLQRLTAPAPAAAEQAGA